MGDSICNKYFWQDIKILINAYSVDKDYCKSDVINHVVFAFIVLTVIGGISAYVLEKNNVFVVFLLLSVLHATYWYFKYTPVDESKNKVETFQTSIPDGYLEEVIGQEVTYPTANNPYMNVLVDEIKYNPTRAPAISTNDPSVNIQLNEFFQTQFINDPTDVFNNTQSQRQFYTMPSTTVPNDQESYQNWLYKIPGKTCKEGGREACALATGSDGGVIPWLTNN
jgi:hypothetical protein